MRTTGSEATTAEAAAPQKLKRSMGHGADHARALAPDQPAHTNLALDRVRGFACVVPL